MLISNLNKIIKFFTIYILLYIRIYMGRTMDTHSTIHEFEIQQQLNSYRDLKEKIYIN